jgi:hypothetical protein
LEIQAEALKIYVAVNKGNRDCPVLLLTAFLIHGASMSTPLNKAELEASQENMARIARTRAAEKVDNAVKCFSDNEQDRRLFYELQLEIGTVPPSGMTEHQKELDRLVSEVCNGQTTSLGDGQGSQAANPAT